MGRLTRILFSLLGDAAESEDVRHPANGSLSGISRAKPLASWPYLWGLGAFGQLGVERVLEILRKETCAAMQQVGALAVKHFTAAMVQRP